MSCGGNGFLRVCVFWHVVGVRRPILGIVTLRGLICFGVVGVVLAACESSPERTEPLRMYGDDDREAIHVAEFNDQLGPGTKSVTIPESSSGIIVRFDCVGDGDVQLSVSHLDKVKFTCVGIAEDGYSTGGMNTGGDLAVRKGTKTTMKVVVADDVRWSMGVDLINDKETFDRLAGADS